MHPLLYAFQDAVKEASTRWMREAAQDRSLLRSQRLDAEAVAPFLDNPQGVLAPGGKAVREGLKLDPAAAHLSDVKHWPEAKEVLDRSLDTTSILHAHRNPMTPLESMANPAWGEEALRVAKEPLRTHRELAQPLPSGPSRLPQRTDIYKGLAKIVPKDKIRDQGILQAAWRGVIPPGLPGRIK